MDVRLPGKRKAWSAQEKMAIVLDGLKGAQNIANLCRQAGISQSMYYDWRGTFIKFGFEGLKRGGKSFLEQASEKEVQELRDAVSKTEIKIEILMTLLDRMRGLLDPAREARELVAQGEGRYPVAMVCELMGISRTTYYKLVDKPPEERTLSDRELLARIRDILSDHPGYGYRRVLSALRSGPDPLEVNHKRIQRLMQLHGLGARPKK